MHEEQKTLLTDYDLHLLMEGTHLRAWTKLGAHPCESNGRNGTWFAVWAPNAESVSVIGDFNNWDETKNPLACRGDSGIWEGFITGVGHGYLYKYAITSRYNGYKVQKADPYGFFFEIRPNTASVVWDISNYSWSDGEWMATRRGKNNLNSPISIY
ncbi:MAG: GlgB N-terminal domain-containing protein, partial [Dissulfurimicrobium sp.]